MKLWRVVFKATLKPAHPKFYDYQFGFFVIWVYAFSAEEAIERVEKEMAVAAHLYTRVGTQILVSENPDISREGGRLDAQLEQNGICFEFHMCPPGADGEEEFEKMDLARFCK